MKRLLAFATALAVSACTGGVSSPTSPQSKHLSERRATPFARTERSPARCARSHVPRLSPEVRGIAYPRGTWPVYAGLGTGGLVHYGDDQVHHGWRYHKTVWAVASPYAGPVVITGHEVNGRRVLRFHASGPIDQVLTRLRFPPVPLYQAAEQWRYGVSTTLFKGPGCYAFTIRGRTFTQFIAFLVRP